MSLFIAGKVRVIWNTLNYALVFSSSGFLSLSLMVIERDIFVDKFQVTLSLSSWTLALVDIN